jgi:hypothetical protein
MRHVIDRTGMEDNVFTAREHTERSYIAAYHTGTPNPLPVRWTRCVCLSHTPHLRHEQGCPAGHGFVRRVVPAHTQRHGTALSVSPAEPWQRVLTSSFLHTHCVLSCGSICQLCLVYMSIQVHKPKCTCTVSANTYRGRIYVVCRDRHTHRSPSL